MPGAGSGFLQYTRRAGVPTYKKVIKGKVHNVRKLRTVAVGKTAAKTVAAIAKQVVQSQAEKKFIGGIIENTVSHNASITSGDMYPVLPPIAQGTSSNQRTGDKVTPTGMYVDAAISFNDYGEGYIGVPLRVFAWVLQSKSVKSYSNLGSVPIQNLMDGGSGPTSFDGSTMNSLLPVNKEEFDILGAREFRISDMTAENSKCLSKRISLKINTPAKLHFDPASSTPNYATNFAPFMVVGWCRDDGVTPSSLDVYLKVTSWCRLYYTDL